LFYIFARLFILSRPLLFAVKSQIPPIDQNPMPPPKNKYESSSISKKWNNRHRPGGWWKKRRPSHCSRKDSDRQISIEDIDSGALWSDHRATISTLDEYTDDLGEPDTLLRQRSVYLSDFIAVHEFPADDMDPDLQIAILCSLETTTAPPSETKRARGPRRNARKSQGNSFGNYWTECQRFHRKLRREIKSNDDDTPRKDCGGGMDRDLQLQITNIMRKYFKLCRSGRPGAVSDKMTIKRRRARSGRSPFSVDAIYDKLHSIAPAMDFRVTKLGSASSANVSSLAFHGTDSRNVPSIRRKGLVVGGTEGVAIRNGSAYGNGIYCSPSLETASAYSGGAIFVCHVAGNRGVRRLGSIWVVPQSKWIKPVALIQYSGGYLHRAARPQSGSMFPNGIALFTPSIGPLNEFEKHRNRRRRFSHRPPR